MRTHLKVCCIASIAEARLAVSLGATALGLAAEMPSGPGPVPDALLAAIAASVPPPISRVLLTSRTEPDAVVAHAAACGVDTVQLTDAVPEETYLALRRRLPHVRIVQVVHIAGPAALAEAERVAPHVHAILLESGRPRGGAGRGHDWPLSARIVVAVDRPVFLAGGLGPENVAAAIRQVGPWGIDICTGVRTGGQLDPMKLAALAAAMEAADAARLQS